MKEAERVPLKTILQNFLNHVESLEARRVEGEDTYDKEFQVSQVDRFDNGTRDSLPVALVGDKLDLDPDPYLFRKTAGSVLNECGSTALKLTLFLFIILYPLATVVEPDFLAGAGAGENTPAPCHYL